MTRAAAAFVAATALAAAVFGRGPDPATLGLVVAATGVLAWGAARRPRRWSLRAGYLLLAVYLVAWGAFAFETRRVESSGLGEKLGAAARTRVAGELGARLSESRGIAERVAAALADEASGGAADAVADPDLFLRLGRVTPADLPGSLGIEVYDRTGTLRAWWGDPRGNPVPGDSVAGVVRSALVLHSSGTTLAYVGAPWVVAGDTLTVVVKDVWSVESPLPQEVMGIELPVPRLEAREFLEFRVAPISAPVAPGLAVEPVRDASGRVVARVVEERFQLDRYLAERRARRDAILALALLWPLLWTAAGAWSGAERAGSRWAGERGPWRRWAAVTAGRLVTAVLAAVFLVEKRYLAHVVPEEWFSPLGFAFAPLGPAGRSPGDFLTVASLLFLLCLSAYALLPEGRARGGRLTAGAGAMGALAASWVLVGAAAPVLERAMLGLSPEAFFSPTLLFAPALLMSLLGFALLAGVGVLALAALGGLTGVPTGRGWIGGVAVACLGALGVAAWSLPAAALSGRLASLVPALAVALAGAGWLARAAGRRGGAGSGRVPATATTRLGLVALALACMITLPLVAWARVQAAHELLVERAVRIGEASSQWLDYTMSRSVEFLASEPAVAEAILERNPDAGLSLWSRSPLSGLDFATGLYLFDADGEVVSEFSLTAEDLVDRARRYLGTVEAAQVAVRGSEGTMAVRWAVVPVAGPGGERVGTAVALTTGALELREQAPGTAFVLTNLLAGAGLEPDLPGYTTLGPQEAPPPRTLVTRIETEAPSGGVRLAMPLDPLLPGPRGFAVFLLVGALWGLILGGMERAGDPRVREGWRARLGEASPLGSFRIQLLVAFLAVAAVPLALYAVLGFRTTRAELQEATRTAADEALSAASRLLVEGPALEVGTSRALSSRLREISGVLHQDFVLYWRGRTVASSRPEIFASRLFADRMEGSVYAELFAVRRPIVFDATTLGDRSFLVAYRRLAAPDIANGYVLATPLLIREDRVRLDLQRLGEGVFLLSAFSIGFLLVVGWGLARFMARPLSDLEAATRQIADGQLSYRLPTPARRDEFGRVQQAFNVMAGRLDESQRALEREKSRVQAILASVGAGVVALDGRGRVRLINDRAAALLDQRADDVLGRHPTELAAGSRGLARRFWDALEAELSGDRRTDRDLAARDGQQERHYHLVTTGLRDGGGEDRGLVVAFEDITENVQSQRVLAWGEMARQVAHEIKNPLTPMKLSLQHLERVMADRRPDFETVFRENLDLVLAEIDRLEAIAGSFARFAVPQPAGSAPFDAVAVARDVVDLYATGEGAIEYRLTTSGSSRPLLGEPEEFRRVLVNLVQNARDAIVAGSGKGVVELRFDWTGPPETALISVLDDGVGLPAEGVERLFEPSFSTKTRGTGLGLAITRRIVEAWGGSIDWERRPEGGTAIHVRLRAAAG